MKAHYVPRCYLKNFANENNRVNVFSKIDKDIRSNTHIAKICCQKDYYKISNIEDNYILENLFANEIEPEFNNLLANLIGVSNILNFKNKLEENYIVNIRLKLRIAKHIMIQFFRSKSYKDIFSGYGVRFAESYIELSNNIEEQTGYKLIDRMKQSNSENNILLLNTFTNGSLCDFVKILYTYKMIILINMSKTEFITSDNPVYRHSYFYDSNNAIYMPISSNVAIICFNNFPKYKNACIYYQRIFNDKIIEELNTYQICNSYNDVFSCNISYLENIKNNKLELINKTNYNNKINICLQ